MKLQKNIPIFLAGSSGMVGSAIYHNLVESGFKKIITKPHSELDLTDKNEVNYFFRSYRPEIVINAAGKVGGIKANISSPVEFLSVNFEIASNLLKFSHAFNIKKVVMIGSSCMYPANAQLPFKENAILSGPLEETNEGFAIAKIASLKLSEYYNRQHGLNTLNLIPPNLYGKGDHFDLENSHVLSALVKRFYDAEVNNDGVVHLWGSGTPKREFMNVDDFAKAVLHLLQEWNSPEPINVGVGKQVSIKTLADLVKKSVGSKAKIIWDTYKPDGMAQKCLDISKLKATGYKDHIKLEDGIQDMVIDYKSQIEKVRNKL